MRIIAADYNTQKCNNIRNRKPGNSLPARINRPAYDTFECTSKTMQNDVSFNGLLSMFKPKFPPAVPADIDTDISTLTEKQKKELKSKVVLEINELLFSKKCTPEKEERLNKLMNSDYFSTETQYCNGTKRLNLLNYISYEPKNINNELFEQFMIKILKKTNESNIKVGDNKTLKKLLNNYLLMDESTQKAKDILNICKKCKEISDFDFNKYLVNCIKNNKPDMYKIIINSDNINLDEKINKNSDRIILDEILHSDNPDIKESVSKKTLKEKYFNEEEVQYPAVMKSYLSVPENKSVEEISKWSLLYFGENNINDNNYKKRFGTKFLNLFSQNLSYDEKSEFIENLFEKVIQNINKPDFNNYYFLLSSIGYNVEQYFNFPQGQFDKIGKTYGFDTLHLKGYFSKFETIYSPPKENPKVTESKSSAQKIEYISQKDNSNDDEIKNLVNTEVFNLDDFEKIYSEIEMRKKYPKSANFLVNFAMLNLPNIFVTPENEEQYKQIIEKLKYVTGDFSKQDNLGNNLAHLAIIAENPYLADLAVDKNVSFEIKNNAGETAIDLIDKYEGNSKVLEAVQKLHINCPELLDFAENDITSGIKMIIKDKYIDINSRNPETLDTPWTVAVKNNSYDVMKLLASHPALDKNAVNKNEDNAGILAAREGNIEAIKLLNGFDDFDINYINPKTNDSVFTTAKDTKTLDEIMKNKNANPNARLTGEPSAIFRILQRSSDEKINEFNPIPDLERFEALCKYKKTDLSLTYESKNIIEYMEKTINYLKGYANYDYDKYQSNLVTIIRNKYFDSVKDIIEKEGILSLNKIKEFVDYPEAEKFINNPLNSHNEPIGFFLADIEINRKNVAQFLEIIKTLQDKGYNFKKKNSFEQTLLDKSKDAENEFLLEYLQKKTIINNANNKKK